MKKIVILGSTGSIGRNTLDVVRKYPSEFKVVGLSAGENFRLLAEQAREFSVPYIGIANSKCLKDLKKLCPGREVSAGQDHFLRLCGLKEADLVVSAIVGADGLLPTWTALQNRKPVALANKESLVAAGEIIMALAKRNRCPITPIDSEHSAIANLLRNMDRVKVDHLILTASGGPFLRTPPAKLARMKAHDALKHPTWNMGAKITVDSATMINKGFEVIEARHLFGFNFNKIDIMIHPESVVHSLVKSTDGSYYAQMGPHDMRFPILSALSWDRPLKNEFKPFDLTEKESLTFYKPDFKKFPLLGTAYEVGRTGGILPAVFMAADDLAVQQFLSGHIGFKDIEKIIRKKIDDFAERNILKPSLEDIIETIREVRSEFGRNKKLSSPKAQ